MTTDIRAKVYCNLGKVISGDFSDDYLQGSGLIRTRGSVVLDGIYKPAVGDKVEFAYYRNGVISKLPRTLRVLSSFADPFRRLTTVEIGCKFTYFGTRKPPVENPKSTDENSTIDCEIYKTAIIPISAAYVFQQCLNVLGLQSDPIPLTNKFSVEEFDLSPGYIQVMSDLLSSEGYFCYLDEAEVVRIRSFNETNNTGPLLSADDLIDLGPVGVGELPGDSVLVRYDSLTLKKPEDLSEQDLAKQNWEYESVTSIERPIAIRTWGYLVKSSVLTVFSKEAAEVWYENYTITTVLTRYDNWNRVIRRTRTTQKPLVAVNSAYIQQVLDYSFWYKDIPFGSTGVNCQEREEEYYFYNYNPQTGDGPCQIPDSNSIEYDSLTRKETFKYQSDAQVYGSVWNKPYIVPVVGSTTTSYLYSITFSGGAQYLVEKTIEYYDKQVTDMTEVSKDLSSLFGPASNGPASKGFFGNVVTKLVREKYIALFLTQEGQRYVNAATINDIYDPRDALFTAIGALGLVLDSREVTQSIGRNAGIDSRPTRSSRSNKANQKADVTESVAEIEWITGSTESNAVIELQMPYAPDDEITYSPEAGYGLIKSDAKAKASNYGKVQNALLLGNRNGVSIQISADLMPPRPFDPIYIEAEGIKGQYRINGTSYTFDSNGIIASTDAMFWGGVS